jgi:anti-sigma factor RsiW
VSGPHLEEALLDLLDGRLDAPGRAAADAHLAECAACRDLRERLDAARGAVRATRVEREPPPGLAGAVRAALDREDARRGHRIWPVAAGLAAALLAAAAVLLLRPGGGALLPAAEAARDHEALTRGSLVLEVRLADAAELERFFAARGPGFPVRVLDLAMMGFTLEGGRVERFGGGPGVLYVYRNARGDRLVCRMYPGRVEDLPPTPDVREHGGFRFHVFREGDRTVVFWQEGQVVCVLTGALPPEQVVALAFEKAMKPA